MAARGGRRQIGRARRGLDGIRAPIIDRVFILADETGLRLASWVVNVIDSFYHFVSLAGCYASRTIGERTVSRERGDRADEGERRVNETREMALIYKIILYMTFRYRRIE